MEMEKVLTHYGLKPIGSKQLDGYDSLNHKIETEEETFVLKIYNANSEFDLAKAEETIINSIASKIAIELPLAKQPLYSHNPNLHSRLLPFIEGSFLAESEYSELLLSNYGSTIGQLSRLLSPLRNKCIESRKSTWDIQHAHFCNELIHLIKEPNKKKLVQYFLDQFEQFVLPKQHVLRHGIIHGDLNEHNILLKNDAISGIIDFGDICYSPIINESAIACTYIMLQNPKDPVDKIKIFLKAYHAEFELLSEEIDLLYLLIAARLCISVCHSAQKSMLGTNSEYTSISEAPAWDLLEKLIAMNPEGFINSIKKHLELSNLVHPDTNKLFKTRKIVTGASLSLSYAEPIHMNRGIFQYMHDAHGGTYLDAYNNIIHVGHCHPKLSQIISTQSRNLNTNTRYLYDIFGTYAEKLLGYFPDSLSKVFFVNSGSAASDLAIRLAHNYTSKQHIAVLEDGYHGNSQIGIDVSAYKFNGPGGSQNPQYTLTLPLPKQYGNSHMTGKSFADQACQKIEQEIQNGKQPAAFIAEPISGCGGQVPLATGYLQNFTPFLKSNKILTIIDEVQVGFGRLGSHFWGFEYHGIVPDIVILGKPMGNGHPIAGVVTTEAIADKFANGMEFFSSFGGNPVSCAVANGVLDCIEEEALQENAVLVGKTLLQGLNNLKNKFKKIGDVRGAGLFIGVEFIDEQNSPNTALAKKIKEGLKENYILTSTDGPHNNVLKIKPPMCFSEANAHTLMDCLENLLTKLN